MENLIMNIETVIDYIESHLDEKLDLEKVSEAVHYSKYHLHRMFTNTVGMTIHDYVQRRQLTEAAKLLVFSSKPIIEVAFFCGYESQQAFSSAFKSMYKVPPAQYRDKGNFYPLQLQFVLHKNIPSKVFTKEDVCIARVEDIPAWMDLMRLVIDLRLAPIHVRIRCGGRHRRQNTGPGSAPEGRCRNPEGRREHPQSGENLRGNTEATCFGHRGCVCEGSPGTRREGHQHGQIFLRRRVRA